jgi:hypothetical protein
LAAGSGNPTRNTKSWRGTSASLWIRVPARAAFAQLDSTTLADRGVIITRNPASCIKTCQMYDAIGVDQVMLIMQTETIPHDKVMGSIEKFGKEVIPAFQGTKAAQGVAATL